MKRGWKGTFKNLKEKLSSLGFSDGDEILITIQDPMSLTPKEISSSMEMIMDRDGDDKADTSSMIMSPPSLSSKHIEEMKEGYCSSKSGKRDKNSIPEQLEKIQEKSRWFITRIKNILKDNKTKRLIGNKAYGRLDHKKLFKISTTGKIFKRKTEKSEKDYSLCLLIDQSGSMGHGIGSRLCMAASCAYMLTREFQDVVDIDVCGFSDDRFRGDEHYKKFKQKKMTEKELDKMRETIYEIGGGGNHDFIGVRKAHERLSRQKSQEKYIIVLSDGEPSCGCDLCHTELEELRKKYPSIVNNYGNALLHEIKEAEHDGIYVIGIGIKSQSVKRYYKTFGLVDELDMLYPEILKTLSSTTRRTRR